MERTTAESNQASSSPSYTTAMSNKNPNLRIIPLGGLGEIGKNMMAIEYGEAILVIDCGLMFPDEAQHGVDIVLPDAQYVIDRRDNVVGMVITHGHEDHIGGLQHILPDVGAPVYGTALTIGLVSVKLRESRRLRGSSLETLEPGDTINLGPFGVTLFRVNHSIPDATGVIIDTPVGKLVHTGDFKLDHTPVDGKPTDFQRLAQAGEDGVLLLLSDSTYADVAGHTPSEAVVGKALTRFIGEAQGRVIVASFASLISRIQQVADAAAIHGRRLGIVGRSMVDNVRLATELGYLRVPEGLIIPANQLESSIPEKTVIMTTGAQGEPTSALVRMARGTHQQVRIEPGDTIIISANPIPGNEAVVGQTIDGLFRLGADVLYSRTEQVHVRGHASQEDLKLMLRLTKPRYFVPIHGDYRHLVHHTRLAESVGIPDDNIFLMADGDVLEIDHAGDAQITEQLNLRDRFVSGLQVGSVDADVLHERAALSRDGIVAVSLPVDSETFELVGDPVISIMGFVDRERADDLSARLVEVVDDAVAKVQSKAASNPDKALNAIESAVREELNNFIYKDTRRRPRLLIQTAPL